MPSNYERNFEPNSTNIHNFDGNKKDDFFVQLCLFVFSLSHITSSENSVILFDTTVATYMHPVALCSFLNLNAL